MSGNVSRGGVSECQSKTNEESDGAQQYHFPGAEVNGDGFNMLKKEEEAKCEVKA